MSSGVSESTRARVRLRAARNREAIAVFGANEGVELTLSPLAWDEAGILFDAGNQEIFLPYLSFSASQRSIEC
jgi:hypothetical protein